MDAKAWETERKHISKGFTLFGGWLKLFLKTCLHLTTIVTFIQLHLGSEHITIIYIMQAHSWSFLSHTQFILCKALCIQQYYHHSFTR